MNTTRKLTDIRRIETRYTVVNYWETDGVYDASVINVFNRQTGARKYDHGMSGFQVDEFTIFAPNLLVAKMVARALKRK